MQPTIIRHCEYSNCAGCFLEHDDAYCYDKTTIKLDIRENVGKREIEDENW